MTGYLQSKKSQFISQSNQGGAKMAIVSCYLWILFIIIIILILFIYLLFIITIYFGFGTTPETA